MSEHHTPAQKEQWSSPLSFVLAAAGAAVGLGNVWKFPYITGENGGGAFVLVYLLCVFFIGIPLLIAEIYLGRHGGKNPQNSMANIAHESGASKHWGWVGFIGIAAGFLILSYYSVIAGWALDYLFQAINGGFTHKSAAQITQAFETLTDNPIELSWWHTVIIFTTIMIVAKGVQQGLEKAVRFMLPAMLVLLFILLGFSISTGFFQQGLQYLFTPHFDKLSAGGLLSALGHSFFTMSIATGSIMMYGAYVPKHCSISTAAVGIAFADTSIALISGMVIFPIVFANGMSPGAGPGLIFNTLPLAFGQMPHGVVFASLFFAMLVFAALTSSISLIEPSVAWMMERYHMSRKKAVIICGVLIWLLGFGTVFSFNTTEHIKYFGMTFFELLDYITANIMLPLGGLLIAIFAAWKVNRGLTQGELHFSKEWFAVWRFCLGVVTPIGIGLIVLKTVGVI